MLAIYVSMMDSSYSRSGVYFSGDPGNKIFKMFPTSKFSQVREVFRIRSNYQAGEAVIVVMSPNHALVTWFKIFTNFEVILDAGWPLSDSSQSSKGIHKRVSHFKNLIIDFVSFHLADKVILESQAQKIYVGKKFGIHKDKIHVLLTGLNEQEFVKLLSRPLRPMECQNLTGNQAKFVLFRGKNNLESGLPTIVETAQMMSQSTQFVIVTDKKIKNLSQNVILIARHVSIPELIWLYQNSSCVLGQVSSQSRLNKTLPHKLFETAYFSKCYISPSNSGIREFLNESAFIPVSPVNSKALKESIELSLSNEDLQQTCAKSIQDCYRYFARQEYLSKGFRQIIETAPKHFS